MIKKIILLQCIIIGLTLSCFGQINKNQSYDELEALAISCFQNNKADSAIIILEYAFQNFPEELPRSSSILALVYLRIGNLSKPIEIWEIGIEEGYIYGLNNSAYQEYYKDNTDFKRLAEKENNLLETLHIKHEIVLPAGFSNKRSYPILFIFHGNSRNIEKSKLSWNAPVMSEEFITVFLQSYLPASSTDFRWVPDDDKTREELMEIYDHILKTYPVDDSKIIFAGMSAGGYKALELTFNNNFPVSGLVLNCPVIPPDIEDEMIIHFVEKNKKMGIITGENDFALENQKVLVSRIDKLDGQTKILINMSLGHSFAENFSQFLDEYLRWVIE